MTLCRGYGGSCFLRTPTPPTIPINPTRFYSHCNHYHFSKMVVYQWREFRRKAIAFAIHSVDRSLDLLRLVYRNNLQSLNP